MAVPKRPNEFDEDGEDGDVVERIFDEEDDQEEDGGWIAETDIPFHLLALARAAESGDLDAFRNALDSHSMNGTINDPIEDGDTALHLCCLYGYLPCVQLLLDRGASPEIKDEEGAIPLHDACAGGYTEIVQLLINSGNSAVLQRMLNTVEAEGETPLRHAARGEHTDVVRLLLAVGASPHKVNIYGKTPAELADPGTEVKEILEDALAYANSVPCQ